MTIDNYNDSAQPRTSDAGTRDLPQLDRYDVIGGAGVVKVSDDAAESIRCGRLSRRGCVAMAISAGLLYGRTGRAFAAPGIKLYSHTYEIDR